MKKWTETEKKKHNLAQRNEKMLSVLLKLKILKYNATKEL